jgi:peptidoglycan/xylan/chitin deacetylase (PgdA/CDA1 family)
MHLARVPWIGKLLFRDALSRIPTQDKKIVYLTFDDGPIPEVTPLVLDVLKKHNAKATFFCVGDNVKKHPEVFKRIVDEGHAVGNHTFNHSDGWRTDNRTYFENIEACAQLVSSNLFRPPYGRIRYSQYKKLKKKYRIILWDVLSWDYDAKLSAEKCLEIVKKNIRQGSIIVFHDSLKTRDKIAAVLTGTLDFMKETGYETKPISLSV